MSARVSLTTPSPLPPPPPPPLQVQVGDDEAPEMAVKRFRRLAGNSSIVLEVSQQKKRARARAAAAAAAQGEAPLAFRPPAWPPVGLARPLDACPCVGRWPGHHPSARVAGMQGACRSPHPPKDSPAGGRSFLSQNSLSPPPLRPSAAASLRTRRTWPSAGSRRSACVGPSK